MDLSLKRILDFCRFCNILLLDLCWGLLALPFVKTPKGTAIFKKHFYVYIYICIPGILSESSHKKHREVHTNVLPLYIYIDAVVLETGVLKLLLIHDLLGIWLLARSSSENEHV